MLDLESTDQLEITSSDMLGMLLDRLRDHEIDLYLVQVRFRVRSVLKRTGVRERLGEDHLWHSISQGVRSAREDHGLKPVRDAGAAPAVHDEEEDATLPEAELIVATTGVEADVEADLGDDGLAEDDWFSGGITRRIRRSRDR